MFGYTVFLKIGNLGATALTDLYRESYELIGCEYGFSQGVDIKGQAQTEVKGGKPLFASIFFASSVMVISMPLFSSNFLTPEN